MRLRTLIVLPLLVLAASPALAQDDTLCRNGAFPAEPPFALARIGGEGRAWFEDDRQGCPGSAGCRSRSYLVPGDVVIINRTRGGYACAFYPSAGGGTAGWIASPRVELLPNIASPALDEWTGSWSSEGNPEVTIARNGEALAVEGESYWPGREPSPYYPSVNVGEISGSMRPAGQRAQYRDLDGCVVDFTLLAGFLIAGDNGRCGGMNVSFSAVYRRRS